MRTLYGGLVLGLILGSAVTGHTQPKRAPCNPVWILWTLQPLGHTRRWEPALTYSTQIECQRRVVEVDTEFAKSPQLLQASCFPETFTPPR
jgi:hypothetical protein